MVALTYGPELYNEIQRLIADWYGRDAAERTAALPQLAKDLAQLSAQAQQAAAQR